jgi:hypothetical protein
MVQILSPADRTSIVAGYSPFPESLSGTGVSYGGGPLTWTDFRGRVGTYVVLGTGANITANLVVQDLTPCATPY